MSQNERARSAARTSSPGSALAASATLEPGPPGGRVRTVAATSGSTITKTGAARAR